MADHLWTPAAVMQTSQPAADSWGPLMFCCLDVLLSIRSYQGFQQHNLHAAVYASDAQLCCVGNTQARRRDQGHMPHNQVYVHDGGCHSNQPMIVRL